MEVLLMAKTSESNKKKILSIDVMFDDDQAKESSEQLYKRLNKLNSYIIKMENRIDMHKRLLDKETGLSEDDRSEMQLGLEQLDLDSDSMNVDRFH